MLQSDGDTDAIGVLTTRSGIRSRAKCARRSMWWKSAIALSVRRWCSRQYCGQRTLEEGTTMVAHALNGVGLSHRGTVGGGVHLAILSGQSLLRRHFDSVAGGGKRRGRTDSG